MQFTTYFDNALSAENVALDQLPRTDVVATYFRGTSLGNATACCVGKQLNYDPTRANTGELTAKVEIQANAFGLEWGEMLTPGLRTDTTATAGSFVDDGGSTALGGQAYVQLTAFTGTSVTIAVQHATTSGGSYANVTGLATSALTAIGAVRLATTPTTTINEFVKVTTTGTFTSATFAVSFMRNKVAVSF